MPEMILPGVYIEEHAEGLIVSGPIATGNIGIVGTAKRGPIDTVQVLGGYTDALQAYGLYDTWVDGNHHELTLVRALEQAYANGATTVYAVRVTSVDGAGATKARAAKYDIRAAGGAAAPIVAVLIAGPHDPTGQDTSAYGTWGNDIAITSETDDATHMRITIQYGGIQEVYRVTSGNDLVNQVNNATTGSALVHGEVGAQPGDKPGPIPQSPKLAPATAGADGADATDADYTRGLALLSDRDVQIVVAAGRGGAGIRTALQAHVTDASADKVKRERMAVFGDTAMPPATDPGIISPRMVYTAPGIQVTDATKNDPDPTKNIVTLPSAYTAAVVAGMMAARDPQESLTNQSVAVAALERKYNAGQLEQLVQGRVLVLEDRQGIRVVKAITTDDGAFRQITTRRIVDYARNGVRGNAEPFIGLLNDERVRQALKGAINGFLASMVDDEMLESYDLDVSATRDQEIRGIAVVTMTLQPTFSIDFIQVVMYLQ